MNPNTIPLGMQPGMPLWYGTRTVSMFLLSEAGCMPFLFGVWRGVGLSALPDHPASQSLPPTHPHCTGLLPRREDSDPRDPLPCTDSLRTERCHRRETGWGLVCAGLGLGQVCAGESPLPATHREDGCTGPHACHVFSGPLLPTARRKLSVWHGSTPATAITRRTGARLRGPAEGMGGLTGACRGG